MKKTQICLVLFLTLLLPVCALASTRYIHTRSSQMTNVYSLASEDSGVLDALKNGTKVNVKSYAGDGRKWAYISYTKEGSSRTGYVYSSHLTSQSPGGSSSSTGGNSDSALDVMNGEFRRMQVTPRTNSMIVPSQPSGYVNFRYGPSTDCEVISRVYAGHEFTIIAKSSQWAQVIDNETGRVGFIMLKFLNELDGEGAG